MIRSRRKTLALELTREGQLIVRAPLRISRREIDAFVEKHKDWIVRHLAKQAARPTLPPPDAPETQALKTQAQAILPEKVAHWSSIMEVHPTGLRELLQQGQSVLFLLPDVLSRGSSGVGGGP